MSDFYYSRMSVEHRAIYDRTLDVIRVHGDCVRCDGVDGDGMLNILEGISYDHPAFFYVDFSRVRLLHYYNGKQEAVLYYDCPVDQIDRLERHMNRTLDKIMVGAEKVKNASIHRKCRWIHDTLVRNVLYNHDAVIDQTGHFSAFNVRGVLQRKTAVCAGIAKTVTLMGERLGVEIPGVTGYSTANGKRVPHAWNIVCINGVYAQMDVTWDINYSDVVRYTRSDYFCVSDRDMRREHAYEGLPPCPSDSGLSWFEKSRTLFVQKEQCERYMEKRLAEHAKVVYFRLDGADQNTKEWLDQKMSEKAALFAPDCRWVEKSWNNVLGVFYYHLKS